MPSSPDQVVEDALKETSNMDATLAERLAALTSVGHTHTPRTAAAWEALSARLRASGAGRNAPAPGEPMPRFVLPDESGRLIDLEDLTGHGPLVIAFHPGHWCPYCRLSNMALAQAHGRAVAAGGEIVAISPEKLEYAQRLKHEAGAPFPILSDWHNGYALLLGLAVWVGSELQGILTESGRDLPSFHGNKAWMLPLPATFVVGGDGLVVARHVDADFHKRMAIEDMLAAINRARGVG